MAEPAIRSVHEVTHADWLPSRIINFSIIAGSFGGKISRVGLKKNKPD